MPPIEAELPEIEVPYDERLKRYRPKQPPQYGPAQELSPVSSPSQQIAPVESYGPAPQPAQQDPANRPNLVTSGLRAGWNELQAGLAGAAGNFATMANLPRLKDWADKEQDFQKAEAAQYGRPDLENIRDQSLGTIAPFIAYQTFKQGAQWLPSLAFRSTVPGLVLSGLQGVGSMYEQAREAGIENKPGVAAGAAALGVPYAYLDTLTPRFLKTGLEKGFTGGVLERTAKGVGAGLYTEGRSEGAQGVMEQLFRPDLPLGERAQNVIDGALTGGLVGGTVGGITGAASRRPDAISKKPEIVTNDDLKTKVDPVLGLAPPPETNPVLSLPPPDAIQSVAPPEATPAVTALDSTQSLPPPPTTPPTLPTPIGIPPPAPSPVAPQMESKSILADVPTDELVAALASSEEEVKANPRDYVGRQLLKEIENELELRTAAQAPVAPPPAAPVAPEEIPSVPVQATPEDVINVPQAQNFLDETAFEVPPQAPPAPEAIPQFAPPVPAVALPEPPAQDFAEEARQRNENVQRTKEAVLNDFAQEERGKPLGAVKQWVNKLDAESPAEVINTILDKAATGQLNQAETRFATAYRLLNNGATPVEQIANATAQMERQLRQKTLDPIARQNLEARVQTLNQVAMMQPQPAAVTQPTAVPSPDVPVAQRAPVASPAPNFAPSFFAPAPPPIVQPDIAPPANTPVVQAQPPPATNPAEFSGTLDLVHGGNRFREKFLPADQVNPSQRYDGGTGSAFGNYTYLSENDDWHSGDMSRMYYPAVTNVKANFEKAFVLTPETTNTLWQVLGEDKKGKLTGPQVASLLKKQGYDGIIARGWNELSASAADNPAAQQQQQQTFGLDDYSMQDQIVSLKPEKNLETVGGYSKYDAQRQQPATDEKFLRETSPSELSLQSLRKLLTDLGQPVAEKASKQDLVKQVLDVRAAQPSTTTSPSQSQTPIVSSAKESPVLANMSVNDMQQELTTNNQPLPKVINKQNLRKAVTAFRASQPVQGGQQNAIQEPVAASVLPREPAQVSGPMGEGDAQRIASTTRLQQGNTNEKTSGEGYSSQEGSPNQKGSQEVASQAPVATLTIGSNKPAQSTRRAILQQVEIARQQYTGQQMAVPTARSTVAPQVDASSTVPEKVRKTMLKAEKVGDIEQTKILNRINDRASKVLKDPSLAPFHRPIQRAWEASIAYKDPQIFDDVFNEVNKTANLDRPDNVTGATKMRPSSVRKTASRMTPKAVQDVLTPITKNWRGLPEVRVVSESDPNLTPSERVTLQQSQIFKGLGAFTWKNEKPVLLLNSDNLTPSEVLPTLFHEALGHFGLRAAYGQQLSALLRDLYTTTRSIRDAVDDYIDARPALKKEIDSYDPLDADEAKVQLVEEVLAEQSENGVIKQKPYSRLKAFVQRFARWAGLRKKDFSRDEIISIIRMGQQSAMYPSKLKEFNLNQAYLDPSLNASPLRVVDINDKFKEAAENAKRNFDRYLRTARFADLRDKLLPAMSIHHMKERYGKILPGLQKFYNALQMRGANINHLAHIWASVHDGFDKVLKESKETAKLLNEVMQYTALKLDPSKPWAQQPQEYRTESNPEKLQLKKDRVAEANGKYAALRERPFALQVYKNYRTLNDLMIHSLDAETLFTMMSDSSLIPAQVKEQIAKLDPMVGLQNQLNVEEDSTRALEKTNRYFESRANELMAIIKDYIDGRYGDPDAKTKDALQRQMQIITERRDVIKQYPYFHLGRSGDKILSFELRNANPDSDVKKFSSLADRQAVEKILKKAGFDFELAMASDSTRVFLRLDNAAEQDAAYRALVQAQEQGFISQEPESIVPNERQDNVYNIGAQSWLDALYQDAKIRHDAELQDIEASGMSAARKADARAGADNHLAAIKAYILDSAPATSTMLVSQHRKNVPGYMSDMVRAGAYRAQVWTLTLANMASRRQINAAMVEMRAAVKEAQRNPVSKKDVSRERLLSAIVNELALREAIRPFLTGRTWHDTVAAWNHAFFLGLSPSYVLLQFTQLHAMLWPRLVQDFKNVSFTRAAATIAKNTYPAMQLVVSMIREGKSKGAGNWADSPVTLAALNKTTMSQDQKEFILRFVNRGNLDVGSAAREQGRVVEGERKDFQDNILRIAASFGYYSEVATRLIAALSAYELYKRANNGPVDTNNSAAYDKLLDKVSATVDGSMFNYNTTNTARVMGKMGFAGGMTRVMMTFMKYQASLIEALARSVMDGFLGGTRLIPDPAERKEAARGARRFLIGHLTAQMMISGVMGLPALTPVAYAISKLVDWFDDDEEPYDVLLAFRRFLADTFGNDTEKLISKGLGRAAGIEFSSRTSEADIIPFTKLLTDRRDWNDAIKDWSASMFGSPLSMATNMMDGGSKFMNGDWLGGAIQFFPTSLKGPAKAYDMYKNGYVDKKENQYPGVTPSTADIIKQAFGFTPANIADVKEADRYYAIRQGAVTRRASFIRNSLAAAIEKGDNDEIVKWTALAEKFTEDTGAPIVKNIKRVLASRKKEREGADKPARDKARLFPFLTPKAAGS